MKFRPCIDIHEGKVKQIVGGTLTDRSENVVENFVSTEDASYYAKLFKEDQLIGGHVIMLGPNNENQAIKALQAYPFGLQIGGGITDKNAAYYLEKGASHVIVTSYVFKDGQINFENLDKLVHEIGKDKLVLDLSCRAREGKYYVVTDRWQKFTEFEVTIENLKKLSKYCCEFLVHAADVEGQCRGILSDLVSKLGQWDGVPVTYAGGVKSMEDIEAIRVLGKDRVDFTVGSALDIFGGYMSYQEVVQWCK